MQSLIDTMYHSLQQPLSNGMDTTERHMLRCCEPLQNVSAQYRQLCVKLKAFCFEQLAILQILASTLNGRFADTAVNDHT